MLWEPVADGGAAREQEPNKRAASAPETKTAARPSPTGVISPTPTGASIEVPSSDLRSPPPDHSTEVQDAVTRIVKDCQHRLCVCDYCRNREEDGMVFDKFKK